MGSPTSSDTNLETPPFTPSHPLADRLLNFAEFLLGNVEDWSKIHPFCPPAPAPVSFSGSDRFIKGRLPHRTDAISASLTSLFSHAICTHGDAQELGRTDYVFNAEDISSIANNSASAQCMGADDLRPAPANVQSEAPITPEEKEPLYRLNDCQDVNFVADEQRIGGDEVLAKKTRANYLVNNVDQSILATAIDAQELGRIDHAFNAEDISSIANNAASARRMDVDDRRPAPANEHSEAPITPEEKEPLHRLNDCQDVKFVADEQHIGGDEVLAKKTRANSLVNNVDQSIFATAIDKGFREIENPTNSSLIEQTGDVEEGEISDTLSHEERPTYKREGSYQGEINAKGVSSDSSKLSREMQRSNSFDAISPNFETDEGMDEPISSFVSRCRQQLLLKRENQKRSTQNSFRQHSKKRRHEDRREEEQKQYSTKFQSAKSNVHKTLGQTVIQQECSSQAASFIGVDVDNNLSRLQKDTIPVSALSTPCLMNNMNVNEASDLSDKQLVGQVHAAGIQTERLNESSTPAIPGGLCFSSLEAGDDKTLAVQKPERKRRKRCLTEARRRKKQREKQRANERKIAKSGTCKLKFTPYVDKTEEKQKRTCSFYVQGKCNKMAGSCPFLHDVVPLTKSELCKYIVTNRCLKGDHCPYSHSMSSFPCRRFHTRGSCTEGESCRFSHEPISEVAKQDLLRKMEDEQRARQGACMRTGQDGLKATKLADKYQVAKFDFCMKGMEAATDGMLLMSTVNGCSKLTASRMLPSASSSARIQATIENAKEISVAHSHDTTQFSPGECPVKNISASPIISSGLIAKTHDKKSKAEAFLEAQLNGSRMLTGLKLSSGQEIAKHFFGSSSNESIALSSRHSTPIQVSSMSASGRPNKNALNSQPSSLLETTLKQKTENQGAWVSDSPMTLLDLLLKRQGQTISKEPLPNLAVQSLDNGTPCSRRASSVFLDRILR